MSVLSDFLSYETINHAGSVLMLFLIPIGGGIPGGVLLAKNYELAWPFMMLLYFISDVILALVAEPLFIGLLLLGTRVHSIRQFIAVMKLAVQKSISHYGTRTGPLALVVIAFGVDPMTGRAAAGAAGHGFLSGWLIAIIGDMFYFSVIMACTLWLSSVLGDGTTVMFIILALMVLGPSIVRKARSYFPLKK